MQIWKYSCAFSAIFLSSSLFASQSPADPNPVPGPGISGRPTPAEVDRDSPNRCQQDFRDMIMSVDASLRAVQLAQKQNDVAGTRAALVDAEVTLKKVQRHVEMCGGTMRRMNRSSIDTHRDTGAGTGRAIGRALGEGPRETTPR